MQAMVASEEPITRAGIVTVLTQLENAFSFIAEADSQESVLSQAGQLQPEVIILDLKLVQGDLQFVERLASNAKVIALCSLEDSSQLRDFIVAGVLGFVQRCENLCTLTSVVQSVAQTGSLTISHDTAQNLSSAKLQLAKFDLTDQEREMLIYLVEGKTNKQIAGQSNISVKAVEKRISKLYERLHVSSRIEAVKTALENKIVEVNETENRLQR